jgi:arylsulfatase
MNSKPNVLFIMSDQHNAKVIGHKGHPDVKTPNLDRLAEEGVRFDACVAQNPTCTPSRMSIYTGQYCHNHGYYALSGPPSTLPGVFRHFSKAGYRTSTIGKTHCPADWLEDNCDVFEDVTALSSGGNPQYRAYLEAKGLLEQFLPQRQLRDKYADDLYNKSVEADPSGYLRAVDGKPTELAYRDTPEGYTVTRTIEFLEQTVSQSKPFFAHVSFQKPHQVYTPCREFWDLYDEKKISLPPNADYDMRNKSPHLQREAKYWRTTDWALFEPKNFEAARLRKMRGYLGNTTQMDFAVGELLTWLHENGLEENTIVIYISDHGDYACEHGSMEKAPGICSDAITRVPFIWRWPGKFKTGHMCPSVVETVDLVPTLCALTGVEPLPTADGIEISDLLAGHAATTERAGLCEGPLGKSIVKGPFRMVYYPRDMFAKDYPDGFGELYNLKEDPWEMNNLYFDEGHNNVVRGLMQELLDRIITSTRPITATWGPEANTYTREFLEADGKLNPERLQSPRTQHYL